MKTFLEMAVLDVFSWYNAYSTKDTNYNSRSPAAISVFYFFYLPYLSSIHEKAMYRYVDTYRKRLI